MKRFLALVVFALVGLLLAQGAEDLAVVAKDFRHLSNGHIIPSEGYADQPYLVRTDDGAWLCVITTGQGSEGAPGQHVVSMRSTDHGRTWEPAVNIEPADGPEASYAVLLKTPYGRVYAFYNFNTERLREVKAETGEVFKRVDSLGDYVFKYSDDHGRTWSRQHQKVPVREFACDRNNVYRGRVRFFWNVGRPLVLKGAVYVPLHKVGAMGAGFFAQSEGVFLRSTNILTERDPAKIVFETLPDGDIGLRAPPGGGRIAEEQSLVALSDGSMFSVYRTVDGWPACAYSRNDGHTWTTPEYLTYTAGGRRVKHPRAANFVWRCTNGQFLYWFHNHGGSFVARMSAANNPAASPYHDRNPAWVLAGRERDTPAGMVLEWSQPEMLLYDDDPFIRMSYPDLVEEDGRFFVTETQKHIARVHEIPAGFLERLFGQFEAETVSREGLLVCEESGRIPREIPWPELPAFLVRSETRADYGGEDQRAGFSLDFWFTLPDLATGQVLLDSRDAYGRGLWVETTSRRTVRLTMNDGRSESSWDCDAAALRPGQRQHMAIIVDGGPKIISFVVDGAFSDGGEERQFGWGRFSPNLRAPNGARRMKVNPAIDILRLYGRAIMTSEAVGNFRAGRSGNRK